MSYLYLIVAVLPFTKADLTVYYNPATTYGQAVKQQLSVDFTEVCNKWPSKERLMGLKAVVLHEYDRRRIHKYFNVTFVESSDALSFRIGSGNRIVVPKSKRADPREYPGYIDFFNFVIDVHYEDYFIDLRQAENSRIWKRWYLKRNAKYANFVFELAENSYEHFFDEYEFGAGESFFKEGQFYSAESLGWSEPPPPILLPLLPEKVCPLDKKWKLPK